MKSWKRQTVLVLLLAFGCGMLRAQQNAPQLTPPPPTLTLADAEHMAIEHNPRISIAHLLQLAQAQVTREVRSSDLPNVNGNATAVESHEGSRITAGGLNNPIVYERAAGGMTVSQLITDFGRTHDLIESAESKTKAKANEQRATTADIVLAVDEAFYETLMNQSVLKVAEEMVQERQATVDEIGALTAARLKSELDLSFAKVELSQANLLMLDVRNKVQDSMADLNALLGSEADQTYELIDPMTIALQAPPASAEPLVQQAFTSRPDLAALNDSYTAARQFSAAEHALERPTISALATAGGTPVRADQITSSWYGAVGANVNIPIFNGFQYSARAREADLRARAAQEEVRNLRELIARDVHTSVLAAQVAYQRIDATKELLDQSNLAMELAQARYKLGLSGIVELSQAQLAQTQGEIAFANARYAYELALADLTYQTGQ